MNRLNKKQTVYVLAIILAIIQLLFNKNIPLLKVSLIPTNIPIPSVITAKVIRIVDGDTIEIEGKIKIRYIGINTPELHDSKKTIECFGQAASDENKRLVEGKKVYIQKDISETDMYKRLLRYVWVDDPLATISGQLIFVNDYLVRQGFAQVSTFPPDVKYVSQFLEAQSEARENKRGLWSSCPIKK